MKILYFDCNMGADSGRIASALYGLMPHKENILEYFNHLCFDMAAFSVTERKAFGSFLTVEIKDEEAICDLERWKLPPTVKEDARQILRNIKDMGAGIHPEETAFLIIACEMIRQLKVDQIYASSVCVGGGMQQCAGHVFPIPSPAVIMLLKDVPVYGANSSEELCSVEGAAFLRYFVEHFGDMPENCIREMGYGFSSENGSLFFTAYYGDTIEQSDRVNLIHANLDDMTGEAIGFAEEMIWEAGALDVYTTSISMKKNRPAVMLSCICRPDQKDACVAAFLKYTTTLGVRIESMARRTLERSFEVKKTSAGEIRVKKVCFEGTEKWKAEYDDLRRIAREKGIPLREAERYLEEI